jgi:hypothetical protein
MDNRILYDIGKHGWSVENIRVTLSDGKHDNKWVIIAGHGISDTEYDITPDFLEDLCKAITGIDDIWVDKLENIAVYDYLRREITINASYNQPNLEIIITGFERAKYINFQKLPITIRIPFVNFIRPVLSVENKDIEIKYSGNMGLITFDLQKSQHISVRVTD